PAEFPFSVRTQLTRHPANVPAGRRAWRAEIGEGHRPTAAPESGAASRPFVRKSHPETGRGNDALPATFVGRYQTDRTWCADVFAFPDAPESSDSRDNDQANHRA